MSSVMIFQLNRKKKVTWKKPVWSRRSRGIKLSFHPGVRIPDVLLNTLFCFLIGPWGAAPPPYLPICSLGSQSHQPVPELWASRASCLQVCAETSGVGGQVLSVSLDAVIGGGWWSGSRSEVSVHSRKLIPKPRDRRLQRRPEKWERHTGRHKVEKFLVRSSSQRVVEGFTQSTLSGQPIQSLSTRQVSSYLSPPSCSVYLDNKG